jgi:hypothetical protein
LLMLLQVCSPAIVIPQTTCVPENLRCEYLINPIGNACELCRAGIIPIHGQYSPIRDAINTLVSTESIQSLAKKTSLKTKRSDYK